MKDRAYICIDLKSFYASVECRERGLDPMTTHLVVADRSRTEKTICLAVSPALKAYGISGRARLFEVEQRVKEINALRQMRQGGRPLGEPCTDAEELRREPGRKLGFLAAPPRMALYMKCSTEIYRIYLRYVSAADIHVYSIDEVFMDVTDYLGPLGMTAEELARHMMAEVLGETGITATAGIGTNLYLAKIAMDIVAKHKPADEDGSRIAVLDEISYRRTLWDHRPLTDFWRLGRGYARKLEAHGMYTMGDVARCALERDQLLYDLFGVNAELLIDHSFGWEPCTMADVKAYRPKDTSMGTGQALHCPYDVQSAGLVPREMTDMLVRDLVARKLATDQLILDIGYDRESLTDPEIRKWYHGPLAADGYGRVVPKHAHGTVTLSHRSASTKVITETVMGLYDRIVEPHLLVRRITITANHLGEEESPGAGATEPEQLNFFTDYAEREAEAAREAVDREREKREQQAVLDIRKKFGKNALLKGMDLEEGATTIARNGQIGGHKA